MALTVDVIRGFDLEDYDGSKMLFDQYTSTFNQGAMRAGRPGGGGLTGQAVWFFNAGLGGVANYTKSISSQSLRFSSFDLEWIIAGDPSPSPQIWPELNFFRWSDSTGDIMSLQLHSDGTIGVLNYLGIELATTTKVFTVGDNNWNNLEFNVLFGTSGAWEFWCEGVKLLHGTGDLSSRIPDRFTPFRYDEFAGGAAPVLDNLYIAYGDPLADTLASRWGPMWVTAGYAFFEVTNTGWQRGGSFPTDAKAVGDNPFGSYGSFPDGDGGFMYPLTGSAVNLYNPSIIPCFGLNYAVALNACVRPIDMAPQLDLVVRERAAINQIGVTQNIRDPGTQYTTSPTVRSYAIYQQIAPISFETLVAWTDAGIQNAGWGVRADAGPSNQRVTMVSVEKLTTRDLTKLFNCGQGSYVY